MNQKLWVFALLLLCVTIAYGQEMFKDDETRAEASMDVIDDLVFPAGNNGNKPTQTNNGKPTQASNSNKPTQTTSAKPTPTNKPNTTKPNTTKPNTTKPNATKNTTKNGTNNGTKNGTKPNNGTKNNTLPKGNFSASFTSYNDFSNGKTGSCIGGKDSAALSDKSSLWTKAGGKPCMNSNGATCKCPDGSSCPHQGMWQCNLNCPSSGCGGLDAKNCVVPPALSKCTVQACGDKGCSNFKVREALASDHPCNKCKVNGLELDEEIEFLNDLDFPLAPSFDELYAMEFGDDDEDEFAQTGQSTQTNQPTKFDLCLDSSNNVCSSGGTCKGTAKLQC